MLCINNTCTDAYFNLATEEYLLKNVTEDIFMVWQNEPSIILGKHQDVWAEVNLDFAREKQLKVVRRYSGGGTVYHDLGNINLTFIEHNERLDFDKFTDRTLDLLLHLGIHAQADKRRGLNIDGLKISGSAQSIHKDRVLYHATLLYSSNLDYLISSLENNNKKNEGRENKPSRVYVKSVKSPVTNISEHLEKPTSINDFKEKIISYFLGNNSDNRIYKFNEKDLSGITELKNKKYVTPIWTFNDISEEKIKNILSVKSVVF